MLIFEKQLLLSSFILLQLPLKFDAADKDNEISSAFSPCSCSCSCSSSSSSSAVAFPSSSPPLLLLFTFFFSLPLLVTVIAAIKRLSVLLALFLLIMYYHYCCDPPASVQSELDESMQQIQVENARLEAELKYEKQRADMLHQDLQDSQKVSQ